MLRNLIKSFNNFMSIPLVKLLMFTISVVVTSWASMSAAVLYDMNDALALDLFLVAIACLLVSIMDGMDILKMVKGQKS